MHFDVSLQDLTKDVFRIDAIPSQSLDTVREWLSSMDIKFYENKVNLNWKQVLKSIVDVSLSALLTRFGNTQPILHHLSVGKLRLSAECALL